MKFVVFADSAAGAEAAREFCRRVPTAEAVPHASGRPWIVGSWPGGDAVQAEVGARRILLLGCTRTTADALARALGAARGLGDLDKLARSLPGSFFLVASLDGRVRVQGSVSTVRQVHYTRANGTVLAGNQPGDLATFVGGRIDEERLALRLLAPATPWPLGERSLWKDVSTLAAGCYLEIAADGARQIRWWSPPEPATPLSEGADRLRVALRDAVDARAARGTPISADLSGGMDSTSLCFLAAERQGSLLTTRWEAADPHDDDRYWAEQAASRLSRAEHLVVSERDLPAWFAGVGSGCSETDEPFSAIRTRARMVHTAQLLAEQGSTGHLTGHGGDELFHTVPAYLHTLIRTNPVTTVRRIRANKALYRWKTLPVLRSLRENSSYAEWLAQAGAELTAPVPASATADFGWGASPRMPPWAMRAAIEAVTRLIDDAAADDPQPLAPLRAQHQALYYAQVCGEGIRHLDRLTTAFGVPWHAPYLDDQVIEAALAVDFTGRAGPGLYKPALAAAMAGVVPAAILGRATKAEFSAEAYTGLRKHRLELLEQTEDMRLAQLGLVDPGAFRAALLAMHTSSRTMVPLDGTLACEAWLRSLPVAAAA